MSTLEPGLYQLLLAHVGLTALVGGRIYPVQLPQAPTYPAVTYQRIGGASEQHLTGISGLAHPRIQVTAWGKTYESATNVRDQVRLALQAFKGIVGGVDFRGVEFLNDVDLYDPDVDVYYIACDFQIWHREPTS